MELLVLPLLVCFERLVPRPNSKSLRIALAEPDRFTRSHEEWWLPKTWAGSMSRICGYNPGLRLLRISLHLSLRINPDHRRVGEWWSILKNHGRTKSWNDVISAMWMPQLTRAWRTARALKRCCRNGRGEKWERILLNVNMRVIQIWEELERGLNTIDALYGTDEIENRRREKKSM